MVVAVDKSVVVDKLVAVDRSVAEDKVVRCTVVGDGLVGKTGLVKKFVSGQFSPEYVATLKDDYSAQLFASGDVYNLHVTDIAGEVCTCTSYLKKSSFQLGLKCVCFRKNLHFHPLYMFPYV